jgi:hypothetical protein
MLRTAQAATKSLSESRATFAPLSLGVLILGSRRGTWRTGHLLFTRESGFHSEITSSSLDGTRESGFQRCGGSWGSR